MEKEKPLILVSNDDGVMAKGINELVKFLRPLGEIIVMAPDAPRSGSGCALTVTQPVHYQLVKKEVGLTVYKCSGTPTDCIKLARNTVLDRTPDLVVGGINHGDNSATNVHYSGTMGVVFEGCLNGIPSIGFSLCNHAPDADFEAAGPYIRSIAAMILEKGLPPLTCLNVNFPDTADIKGVKICEQAKGGWTNEWAVPLRLLQAGGVALQVDAHKALMLGAVLLQPGKPQGIIADVAPVVFPLRRFQRAVQVDSQRIVQLDVVVLNAVFPQQGDQFTGQFTFDRGIQDQTVVEHLGGDTSLACSAQTQCEIDRKVVELVKTQHEKAIRILTENRAKLDELAQYLYQKETITGEEFMDILNRDDTENKPENP